MNEEERNSRSSSHSHDVAPRYPSSSSSSLLLSNSQPIEHPEDQEHPGGGCDDELTATMMEDDHDDDDETNPNTDIDFDNEDNINGLTAEDMEDATEAGSVSNISSNNSMRKRRLMKKAPDAPKRFKSAYICFVTDKMDDVKKSLPSDMKVTEIMKTLAYMWKNLPPLERLEYEKIAEADKSRYFEEMSHYSGPLQVPNKRQKKPPGAPKRAMSAFLSFSQQMRPQIRAMYPELKNTDISGVLAQKWHNANVDEKRPHIERELREREKYHEDMAHWKEEEIKKQNDIQEKKRLNARNTIDFLDLPSSSIWESLETDIISENGGNNGNITEKEMNAFWEDAMTSSGNKIHSSERGSGNGGGMTSSSSSKNKHHQHTSSRSSSTSLPKGSLKSSESEGVQGGGGGSGSGRSKGNQSHMTSAPPLHQMYQHSVPSSSGAGGERGGGGGSGGNNNRNNNNNDVSNNNNNNYHENRFYAVPFPMSAMPEGQIPYAAFNMSYPEYAIPPGYFAPPPDSNVNNNGVNGGGYSRYPYPMHPYYATRMTGEKDTSGAVRYPPYAPYPPHLSHHTVSYPPPPDQHSSDGYWQWRKFPLPPNTSQMNNNNNNNNGSKGEKGGGVQGVSPYFYDLNNYLHMTSGGASGKTSSSSGNNDVINEEGNTMTSSNHTNSNSHSTTSQQPKKKRKTSSTTKTSSSSHVLPVSGHFLAPPPPYLPPPHSSPKIPMTSNTPNPTHNNTNNTSQSSVGGSGSGNNSEKYNPLSSVIDTLRAVQRSGLSGHPD